MKVSVCMTTYNHEQYIAQAIDSVLAQKTNFDFQLIIGEDCSQDKTRKIVSDYQKKYPQIIRLLLANKNQGMMANWVKTLQAVRSQYLAVLEGDDYWINPYKLQKQVDFLDKHPDYSLCFHATQAFYESDRKKTYLIPPKQRKKSLYSLEDILEYNFIATCSVMYRHNLVKKLPAWFNQLGLGDWPMHILYAMHGPIGYIDKVMARYRIHQNSVFSSRAKADNFLDIIEMMQCLDRHLKYKYHRIISKVIKNNLKLLHEYTS